MNEPQSPPTHGWTSGFGQDPFPGIEDTFSGPPAAINPTVLPVQAAAAAPTKFNLPFNISNMSDLKAMVDRMGGIDGVLSTMGKVQKFMATMQQVAPMIKLFMGNKGSKAATANKTKKAAAQRRRRPASRPSSNKTRTRRPAKRR